VSARTALSLSLNTPAVRVLRLLGYPRTRGLFNELGFEHIDRDSSHYTDSLILGGCEVTLIELAAAYRSLAIGGVYAPLRWTRGSAPTGKKVLSPESSWMVSDILQDERRLIPLYQDIFKDKNRVIAFKTGTSHGLRDAWSAGFTRRLTIVVWFGVPDGRQDKSLIGLDAAAPVMLKLFQELWGISDETRPKCPDGVYERKVCALSGALPGKFCPKTINDYAIKDVSSMEMCGIHKNIGGKLVTQLPRELDNWFQFKNRGDVSSHGIKITRPFSKRSIIKNGDSSVMRVFFSAEGELPHYWYLDGRFQAVDQDGAGLFMDVPRGRHKASVLSGEMSDAVEFEVITPGDRAADQSFNILN
jgi:penicillin-binding protein 1C